MLVKSKAAGLVENLRRQGLNDADKGEAIVEHIKLLEKSGPRGCQSENLVFLRGRVCC